VTACALRDNAKGALVVDGDSVVEQKDNTL
jgi:hypothetical protein